MAITPESMIPGESAGASEPAPPLAVSEEERLWGMLAHVSGLVGYSVGLGQIIAPLLIYLVFKEKSRFVAFHALQTVFLHTAAVVLSTAAVVLAVASCGLALPVAVILLGGIATGTVVLGVLGAIQAYDRRLYPLLIVGDWARRQMRI